MLILMGCTHSKISGTSDLISRTFMELTFGIMIIIRRQVALIGSLIKPSMSPRKAPRINMGVADGNRSHAPITCGTLTNGTGLICRMHPSPCD